MDKARLPEIAISDASATKRQRAAQTLR